MIDRERFAELLDVGTATLDRPRAGGKLPAPVKIGAQVRWPLAESWRG